MLRVCARRSLNPLTQPVGWAVSKGQDAALGAAELAAKAAHFPPRFAIPSGIPCPYLTAKKVGGGLAHLALAGAPFHRFMSGLPGGHFPPKFMASASMCPYLAAKDQLERAAASAPAATSN